jgi:hypothetical protein
MRLWMEDVSYLVSGIGARNTRPKRSMVLPDLRRGCRRIEDVRHSQANLGKKLRGNGDRLSVTLKEAL